MSIRQNKKKKVLIAMSGGVDSSVAAALLKKQGYNCVGVFFVTWTQDIEGLTMCPWEQDVFDARRVCAAIGIPLYTFNFEKEYKERVVEYLFSEYEAGRTPNPDVMCNREIKFDLFLEKAKQLGFDYIATGHYAQIKNKRNSYQLHKGKDKNKDQSYFLYTLKQNQLKHALFPIGSLDKSKVRKLAKKFKLPNWDKKDSQGICFLGKVKLKDFLQTRIPVRVGNIVDASGKIVGKHEGVEFYTIGQRKGLQIGGAGEPYYVVKKDVETNTLIVSKGNIDKDFTAKNLEISELSWVDQAPKMPYKCFSKIRYRQEDQKATLANVASSQNALQINFNKPQRAAALGQSVVFYKKTQVIGGGVVVKIDA